MSETPIKCWLIERGQAVGHEPTLWWSKSRYPDSETGRWTRVAGDAMRFPTEEAAKRYADIYAGPHCTVTEHIFIDREVVPVDVIGLVVDEFLRWPLPDSVCCDPCACTPGYPNRSGTNLLTAQQARQMFEYLLEKLPRAESRFERAATDACARRAEALERALAAERERADRNQEDAERLDWMDKSAFTAYRDRDPEYGELYDFATVANEDRKGDRVGEVFKTIREAIDAARRK